MTTETTDDGESEDPTIDDDDDKSRCWCIGPLSSSIDPRGTWPYRGPHIPQVGAGKTNK